jgi:hypothetical protein
LEVAEDGRYAVRLTAGAGPEYGRFDVLLDGKSVAPEQAADFYAAEPAEVDLLLGKHELTKGRHTLTFRPVAGAPERLGKALAVEMLRLLKLPPEARREVRTHHEAHFVRLGIGRAVYAYRLAFGELPDSLGRLVESGIMPARYLNDENNHPLKSRLEDGYFVVESAQPDGWKHRWQGLDARR